MAKPTMKNPHVYLYTHDSYISFTSVTIVELSPERIIFKTPEGNFYKSNLKYLVEYGEEAQ